MYQLQVGAVLTWHNWEREYTATVKTVTVFAHGNGENVANLVYDVEGGTVKDTSKVADVSDFARQLAKVHATQTVYPDPL